MKTPLTSPIDRNQSLRPAVIRSLVIGAIAGGVCVLIANRWSVRIGIIACCYVNIGIGWATGKYWASHRLPPTGAAPQIVLGSTGVTLAAFYAGIQPHSAIYGFQQKLLSGNVVDVTSKLGLTTAALLAIAYLGRWGLSASLSSPFCTGCGHWSREIRSYGYFDFSKEQVREHLVARDFRYLRHIQATGYNPYRFGLTLCRCDATQILDVDYDPDPGDTTPMEPVVSQMHLTTSEAEIVFAYLPKVANLSFESLGLMALLTLLGMVTAALYILLRSVGL